MSINAIQQASRVLREYERQEFGNLQLAPSDRERRAQEALRRLRADSLEMMAALAACMMDEEIGPRAREISQAVRDVEMPESLRGQNRPLDAR